MTDQTARLMYDVEVGKAAGHALNNQAVREYFAKTEKALIQALTETEPGADGHAAREGLVAQLRANRSLEKSLRNAVESQAAAERVLTSSTASD